MRVSSFIVAPVLLLALTGRVTSDVGPRAGFPETWESAGPPPVPEGAGEERPRRVGRCYLEATFDFHGVDGEFRLPVGDAFARERAEAWANATVAVVVSSLNGTERADPGASRRIVGE